MLKVNKIALGAIFISLCILVAVASVLVSSQLIPTLFTPAPTQTSSPTPLQTNNPTTNQSTSQPSWAEPPTTIAIPGTPPILFSAKILNLTIEYSNKTHGSNMFGQNRTMYPQNVYPVTAYVELTYLGKPQDAPWDMLIESYSVNVRSDTGLSASYTAVMGTNIKEITTHAHDPPPSMYMGVSTVSFRMNMTVDQQAELHMSDDLYSSSPGNSGLWQNGPPNTITMTLLRGDWTANDNGHWLTIVNPEKEIALQTLTLQRIGDGFSYSTDRI